MKQLNSYVAEGWQICVRTNPLLRKDPGRVFHINTNVHTNSLNADVHVQADKVSQDKVKITMVEERGKGP